MITGFVPGGVYRHNSPYTTYDIQIVKVLHVNEKRIKIRFQYVSRITKEVVWFGEPFSDKGKIKIEALEDWIRIR